MKIDKLIEKAIMLRTLPLSEFDYSRLSTEELKELIQPDVTDERIMEILEPVRRERQNDG